ncbi:MAG TPA: c-type cytochrome [Candidatus Didemnitutus sp.]|nr:c-type cytochrome [Candidatus Didemnitutus sp.]
MTKLVRSLLVVTSLLGAQALLRAETATTTESPVVQRGRYLVNNVGLCADCHSPRNEKGEYIRAQWLMGAPLAFAPTVPMPAWSPAAPPIAGLPSMSERDARHFLMTGQRPDGSTPRPPMPEFRFSEEDAAAVAAYLKSLAK